MEVIEKIVDFEYCKKCEYENLKESESPCDECLNNPTNTYSQKPVCFKEKENNGDFRGGKVPPKTEESVIEKIVEETKKEKE